jgi:hypothetical protein
MTTIDTILYVLPRVAITVLFLWAAFKLATHVED